VRVSSKSLFKERCQDKIGETIEFKVLRKICNVGDVVASCAGRSISEPQQRYIFYYQQFEGWHDQATSAGRAKISPNQ